MTENHPVARIALLGDGPTEVGRARRELARNLDEWGVAGDNAAVAILLTNELVTNAIKHGIGPVTLCAGVVDASGCLRIEVHDCSPVAVAPRDADDDDVDGRGLLLVDVLATTWGCGPEDPGKNVWFELRTLAVAC